MKGSISRIVVLGVMLFAIVAALNGHVDASFMQTQRAQRFVYILVNVTPAPIVYAPSETGGEREIAASMARRARGGGIDISRADGEGIMIAQATGNQKAVRVEAAVSPDPTATMLYTNNQTVIMNGTAGTTVTQTCAYTVTVHTTITSWTLYHGLSGEFTGASGATFPGADLLNNTYITSPNPAPTPFVVYPDNNNQFAVLAKSGGNATYCVDLTLNIPSTVSGGAYSTNAVYTLYY
jgi:hypothetical protein